MKVSVKVKLALLWVALMFFYIYNDVFSFLQPGHVAELVGGQLEGIQFTQELLFGAAILMALPSFMVFLSLTLPAKANRLVNIIVGIFHIIVLVSTLLVPGDLWAYYALYMIFEAVFIVLIIWHAWKWPTKEVISNT
ncbi:DUF6326 family protein [[Eubacterium] cellulosolvens]